jgi:enoyl-CoA hydratase
MNDEVLLRSGDHGLTILTMRRGVNALDTTLVQAILRTFRELKAHDAPPVLLVSGHPRIFSPGWDLKRLAGADREVVRDFLSLFNRLILEVFSYPGPTAAAVSGHAVAGGCLLAAACDLRLMARGRARMGLSELNLGVPVPAGSLHMLRARLGAEVAAQVVRSTSGHDADQAAALGLVQRATTSTRLRPLAERAARGAGERPRQASAEVKASLYGEAWQAMADTKEADERFLDCWFSDDAQRRIAELTSRLRR